MESGFCSSWIHLWMVFTVFRSISADPVQPSHYTIYSQQVSFDQAMRHCSPGVLTTISTQQEVSEILQEISISLPALLQNNFTFWVGLRKVKHECVVPSLPLRGFRWTHDGSQDSQVSSWAVEPQFTCTSVRCAALKGEFDGTAVTGWGLIADSCKSSYQFICKLSKKNTEDRETTDKPSKPGQEQTLLEPELFTTALPEPATSEPLTPAAPTTKKPDPRPETPKPEPEPEPSTRPKVGLNYPYPGSEPQGPDPDPAKGKDSCEHPKTTQFPGIRSFILDPGNSSWIKAECWYSVVVELHCLGYPAVWRLLDDSPANFSTVCLPCESGFQKNTLGDCLDIDECSVGTPCRHNCLNTEGSYRCVCSDENGEHHNEDSDACRDSATGDQGFLSGILVPVLIAVAAFVVLLVVVGVTVKCCLMRRSKKRAMEKAEKMAMKSKEDKDSFQTANEKTAK